MFGETRFKIVDGQVFLKSYAKRGVNMLKEFFCTCCGLFHWVDELKIEPKSGYKVFEAHRTCPIESCKGHQGKWQPNVVRVRTYGFGYYEKHRMDFIKKHGWSAPQYVPDQNILDLYEKKGIRIER